MAKRHSGRNGDTYKSPREVTREIRKAADQIIAIRSGRSLSEPLTEIAKTVLESTGDLSKPNMGEARLIPEKRRPDRLPRVFIQEQLYRRVEMGWQEIANDKEKYAAYLCSREWSEKREAVRERANGKCERCLVNDMDAVHHLTYARKYDESMDDLQAICNGCHEFTHGKSDEDPRHQVSLPEWKACRTGQFKWLQCPVCKTEGVTVKACGYTTNLSLRYSGNAIALMECKCESGHTWSLVFVQAGNGGLVSWIEEIDKEQPDVSFDDRNGLPGTL